jgi:hypothetical protein
MHKTLQFAVIALLFGGSLAATALLGTQALAADSAQQSAQPLAVDFAKSLGKIRAIHGVNNGPVMWGYADDVTKYHVDAGFPSTRLHDSHWPSPDVVDVPAIFPIFDADADDPKYYCFTKTDAYLAPIVKNGSRITYRLGASIENRLRNVIKPGVNNHPPKDYAKWAKICINIIRHYNEGWANGYHYNIKYFEIWNEPDGIGTWTGTMQQYFELYAVAARAIKAHDPSLKVGGPVMGGPIPFATEPFLIYCRDHKLPLDFYAWHYYTDSPSELARVAILSRAFLDKYGFKNAESHLTEWHYIMPPGLPDLAPVDDLGNPQPQKVVAIRKYFADMRGPRGAAFTATALMLLQDSPLDMANYYAADMNPWGMFDEWGIPGRVYYVFVAFNQLTKTPNRVACEKPGGPPVTMCAGLSDDRKTASILVSNFGAAPRKVSLHLQNLPLPQPVQAETFAVDVSHEFTSIGKTTLKPDAATMTLDLPDYAVYFVRFGPSSAK